jgi:hypothetical protein
MDTQLEKAIRANCSAFNFVTIQHHGGRLTHMMSQVYILFVFLRLLHHAKLQHGTLPFQLHPHIAAIPPSRIITLSKLFQRPATLSFVTSDFIEQTCGKRNWKETSMQKWSQETPHLFKKDIFLSTWPMSVMHLNNNSQIYKDLFRLHPGLAKQGKLAVQEVTTKGLSANLGGVSDEVVFVHVRRTDYVRVMERNHPFGMYTSKDVDDVITRFTRAHPNAIFIIFSDDEKWCRERLTSLKMRNVLMAPNTKTEVAFAAMVSCDHGIATVGSFGFWAGILGGGNLMRLIPSTGYARVYVLNINETLVNHELINFPK